MTAPSPAPEPKPIYQSRRAWAALLGVLPLLLTLLSQVGVPVPDVAGTVAALDGLVQTLFAAALGGLALWSKLRPDSK